MAVVKKRNVGRGRDQIPVRRCGDAGAAIRNETGILLQLIAGYWPCIWRAEEAWECWTDALGA